MSPVSNTERDIGALQAAVQALTDALKTQAIYHERMMEQQATAYNQAFSDLKVTIAGANDSIDALQKELASVRGDIREAKGSWKMLVGLGTICAVFGGVFVKFVSVLAPIWPR